MEQSTQSTSLRKPRFMTSSSKNKNLGTWVLASEKRSLATLFRFLLKKVVESGNRAQDLRVFSFACYQLSHIGRSESEGLGGVGGSGALKSVR